MVLKSAISLRALSLLSVAVLACDGGPSGLSTGNLAITVSGLPTGSAAAVAVSGPDGYSETLSATGTLPDLTSGTYTVAASPVALGPTVYSGNPSTQSVTVGGATATATVVYSLGSGKLFVAINGLPSSSDAAVTVTNAEGYSQTLTATGTLTGLLPGSYTIDAKDVTAAGGTPYTAAPSTQGVSIGTDATANVTVSYSPPGSGDLNLRIDGMYLTQSTQTYDGSVPLVQSRDGLLRVFVVANRANAAAPAVRVRFYRDLVFQSEVTIPAPGLTVPTAVDESSLSYSWNVPVPGSSIRPGLSILAEVDPSNGVTESNEADNAFPSIGPLALSVRSVPALNVTFVPVIQKQHALRGNVGGVNAANKGDFLELTAKMHPLASFNAVVHAPYTTTTTDTLQEDNGNQAWTTILREIDVLRVAENSSRYYYGVAKVSYTNGIAGVAYVSNSSRAEHAALGWDYLPTGSAVAAHELGHNWGRNHAPCGNPGGVDGQYPRADGSIGVYGLDVATGTLQPPDFSDIMGYCESKWISAYTYKGVLDYLSPASPLVMDPAPQEVQPCLLVWGHIRNGEPVLEPAFQVNTRPNLPAQPGPYSIEARAENGASLFSVSFAPDVIADAPGDQQNFVFAVPLTNAKAAQLASLRLTGRGREAVSSAPRPVTAGGAQLQVGAVPDSVEVRRVGGDRVGLRWDARAHPMVMVRDPDTGEVLSLARGGDVELSTGKGRVDLVLSNGVSSRVKRVPVVP